MLKDPMHLFSLTWRRFLAPAWLLLLLSPAWSSPGLAAQAQPLDLTPEERAFIAGRPVVTKCVDPHWMPLEGIDDAGRHEGVIAEMLALIEERTGLTFTLEPTANWLESMNKLLARQCDIVTSDVETGAPPDWYTKTSAFLDLRNVYITRKEVPMEMDFEAVRHRAIGIPRGYPTIPLIRGHYGRVNFVEVETVEQGLLMVSRGELYAFTDLLPICSYYIQRQGLTNLKIAGHLDMNFPTVMAVRSDMPLLESILSKALSSIDANTKRELFMRWIDIEYDMKMDWSVLYDYVPFIVIALAVVLYWNRRLHSINKKLDEANTELSHLTETDPLTKLKNRMFLDNEAGNMLALSSRNRLPLGVAVFDLDHFKRLNDTYGHLVGDECLVAFAKKLREVFKRETDITVRYGGEEFLLLCIGLKEEEFVKILERFRAEVEAMETISSLTGGVVKFTVSGGYTFHEVSPNAWREGIMAEADANLYRAKRGGRNQVVGSATTLPPPVPKG